MIILHSVVFISGAALVFATLFSAIRSFVLPRSALDMLTRLLFLTVRSVMTLILKVARTFAQRDHIMAFYAPISLLLLIPAWYLLISLGYMGMYWSLGVESWREAYRLSGSSLLTLGFVTPQNDITTILAFSEATIGLILVALLIAYLPTMYAAFSRREAAVTLLEVRAGSPPSAVELILRFNRIHGLDQLHEQWQAWETWFAEIEESHTSLPALVFFRSPRPQHSWVTASGAVLDAAALTLSVIDIPPDPQAALCIRAGYLALRRIADFFNFYYNPDPHFPYTTISLTKTDFDAACDRLTKYSVPLKPDRDQAWIDFAGWRVNYDTVLLTIARFTMAPEAPWITVQAQRNSIPSSFKDK